MVLRKPYAFLIKHFRLIHLIITAILGYLVIRNRELYVYLKDCIADSVNKYDALNYIDYRIFIYFIIGIILFFVIHWLLKYKDKPRRIYIFAIISYVIISIFTFVLFSYLSGFPNNIIDQKVIRLYRDISSITLIIQYFFIGVMFIRGLGFDIKKFNFSKDFEEMNIATEDSEEVEVNVGIDTTNVMRAVRKQRREFGYFFKEFKVYIITIIIILLGILGYKGYNYFSLKYKVYNEMEYVGYNNFIRITDSYYNIGEDNNYIIISFDILRNGKQDRLDVNSLGLYVGDNKYIPNKNICYEFNSLGNCYKKQYITNEVRNYILVYQIDTLNIENSYIVYNEGYDNSFKIKLNLENY